MNKPPRILVVEDNDDNRRLLSIYLTREGYEVIEVRDGVEALEATLRISFDLICSDVQMPRMDGYALCRQLKEKPQTERIPIILITAIHTSVENTLQGLNVGANDFISRPFRQSEFLARVQTQLRIKELQDRLVEAEGVATAGRIAVTMAHEINNPLMGILGFVELLLGQLDKGQLTQEELGSTLPRIYANAQHIRDVLGQLRAMTKAQVYAYATGLEGFALEEREDAPTAPD